MPGMVGPHLLLSRFSTEMSITISDFSGENFVALLTRFPMTCSMRYLSPRSSSGTAGLLFTTLHIHTYIYLDLDIKMKSSVFGNKSLGAYSMGIGTLVIVCIYIHTYRHTDRIKNTNIYTSY